jgi:hypothetical protein
MSLYLGRTPAFTELPPNHVPELMDDFSEHELWAPEDVGPNVPEKHPAVGACPQMKSHLVSCFTNSCKLAVIINDTILQLYTGYIGDDRDFALRRIKDRLDEWRALSPDHLKLEPNNLPNICPPPHIVSQK